AFAVRACHRESGWGCTPKPFNRRSCAARPKAGIVAIRLADDSRRFFGKAGGSFCRLPASELLECRTTPFDERLRLDDRESSRQSKNRANARIAKSPLAAIHVGP